MKSTEPPSSFPAITWITQWTFCPRIALLENGVIIRDIRNENNSAEQELEAYFNVGVEEEAVVEETVVEAAVEEITEKEE